MPTVTSAPSATSSATVDSGKWWVKDPLDPTRNKGGVAVLKMWNWQEDEAHEVLWPLGRETPLIQRDSVIRAASGELQISVAQADYEDFRLLLRSQTTLLIQSPVTGEQWYAGLRGSRNYETGHPDLRTFSVDWQEVDAP